MIGLALWGLIVNFVLHVLPGLAGALAGWMVVLALGAGLAWRQRQDLSNLVDQMSEAEFQRLTAMHHCPTRQHLDDTLAKILNLPTLTTLRHLLATEPTISNQQL